MALPSLPSAGQNWATWGSAVHDAVNGAAMVADVGTAGTTTGDALKATYVSLAGTTPGNVPVIKPAGDARAGVWEFTHNDTTGYLYHLLAGAGMSHTAALIALGVDNNGIGLLVPNKATGRGIVGDQRSTVAATDAYWLHATQRSTAAPLVRLEQNAAGVAPALQLIAFNEGATPPTAAQQLLYVSDPVGQAGAVYAADGRLEWRRQVTIQDKDGTTTSYLTVTDNSGVPVDSRKHTQVQKDGAYWWNPTGTAGTWWPFAVRGQGSHLFIEAGGSSSAVGTATRTALVDFQNGKIGFFGATPVARPTGTPVAATDAATTQTLVNSLRASLVALGLIA